MHRVTRDRLLFGVLAITYTLLMFVLAYVVSQKYALPEYLGAVIPVIAVMAAARGFPFRRKVIFILITLAGLFLIDLAGYYLGLDRFTTAPADLQTMPLTTLIPAVIYATGVPFAYPFLVLAFFVGQHPSRLWSSRHISRALRTRHHHEHPHSHEHSEQEPAGGGR